jgi:hypothetical protein
VATACCIGDGGDIANSSLTVRLSGGALASTMRSVEKRDFSPEDEAAVGDCWPSESEDSDCMVYHPGAIPEQDLRLKLGDIAMVIGWGREI